MITKSLAVALVGVLCAGPAWANCSDEIKALQGKAAAADAVNKPGEQGKTSSPGTIPEEGGGKTSVSAKILEAQAHDGRRDEANCMKAVDEAKAMMK